MTTRVELEGVFKANDRFMFLSERRNIKWVLGDG